jgi:hypothetical protein
MPTIDAWLQAAVASEERDGRTATRPVLEALAAAAATRRAATWNPHAADDAAASTTSERPDRKQ